MKFNKYEEREKKLVFKRQHYYSSTVERGYENIKTNIFIMSNCVPPLPMLSKKMQRKIQAKRLFLH